MKFDMVDVVLWLLAVGFIIAVGVTVSQCNSPEVVFTQQATACARFCGSAGVESFEAGTSCECGSPEVTP